MEDAIKSTLMHLSVHCACSTKTGYWIVLEVTEERHPQIVRVLMRVLFLVKNVQKIIKNRIKKGKNWAKIPKISDKKWTKKGIC